MQSHLLSTPSLYVCPCVYSTPFSSICLSAQQLREGEGEGEGSRAEGGGEKGEYRRVCVPSKAL